MTAADFPPLGVDTLGHRWLKGQPYAFPPFDLIPQVLAKARAEKKNPDSDRAGLASQTGDGRSSPVAVFCGNFPRTGTFSHKGWGQSFILTHTGCVSRPGPR